MANMHITEVKCTRTEVSPDKFNWIVKVAPEGAQSPTTVYAFNEIPYDELEANLIGALDDDGDDLTNF